MRAEEVKGLMEAYSQVHGPNVVDIAAEVWVSACIAEGIDFSQYTLDEITEGFIVDMSSEDLSESLLSEILGMPGAQNLGASLRQGFGQARRAVGGAIGNVAKGVADVAGAGYQGYAGQKTTSSNPLARLANASTRFQSSAPRAAASFAAGVLTGKPGATNAPAKSGPAKPGTPAKPKMPGLPPSAAQPGTGPKGNTVGSKPSAPTAKPTGTTPTTKPATTSAAPKPTTSAAPAKPAGSAMDQWAAANPKLAAAKAERDRTRGTSATTNPLMKDTKSSLPTPKAPAPSTAKTGFDLAKKGVNLAAGVDIFDLVKGHLLDEGYADSEEGAIVIMTNMSEEWRKSILESHGVEILDEISKELATKAFANRATRAFEMDDTEESGKADKTKDRIVKKYGKKAGDEAEKAAERGIYGHNKYSEAQEREKAKKKVTKEELQTWVDQLIAEGYDLSGYTWEEVAEIYAQELELTEAQAARENPEKYEREEKKKSAPVRGEKTPMPPRGDKRREEFEKWYAANVR
jgi:hypothetical protein